MKKIILIALGWLVWGQAAHAASFDCAKAQSKVEHLICDNAEISKLDEGLNAAYKTAVPDKTKAEAVKQAQKLWMTERNNCADAACVKGAYEARLSSLAVTHTSSDNGEANKQSSKGNSQNGRPYHFQLTKGKGVPVCDAYLERLNTTEYVKPPYCDRPENDAVKGFVRLNRAPVPASIVSNLYPIVSTFMSLANQKNLDWTDMYLQQRLVSQSKSTSATMQDWLNRNSEWAKIWSYDPPIDIDNDGVPDNVEIWHGHALPTGVGGKQCGDDVSDIFQNAALLRQPQIAFVITGSNDRLDVLKTTKIFAHPTGGYPLYMDGQWIVSGKFHPVGRFMGIFKYQDIYYFDTFFDGWGDFEGKRRTEGTQHKDKNIANTLAVFLHKDGKTKQVCEYLMTDNETQTERGAK